MATSMLVHWITGAASGVRGSAHKLSRHKGKLIKVQEQYRKKSHNDGKNEDVVDAIALGKIKQIDRFIHKIHINYS